MADEVKSFIRVKNEEEQQAAFLSKLDAIKNAIAAGGGGGGGFNFEILSDSMETEITMTANTWNNFVSNIVLEPNKLYIVSICASFKSHTYTRGVTVRSGIHTNVRQSVDISNVDNKIVTAQIIDFIQVEQNTFLSCDIYPVQYGFTLKNIYYNVIAIDL